MNKKILGAFVAVLTVAMLTLPMSVVFAAKPMDVSGQWFFTGMMVPPYTDIKNAGANRLATQHNTGEYDVGPILGTFEQHIYMKIHFGDPEVVKNLPPNPMDWPPNNYNWHIERTFTGTVDGKSGTLTMNLEAKGSSPGYPGSLTGTWVIIGGTDQLANLHGQGTWTNLGMGRLAYEGKIHFDP